MFFYLKHLSGLLKQVVVNCGVVATRLLCYTRWCTGWAIIWED